MITGSAPHPTGPRTRTGGPVDDLDTQLRRAVRGTSAIRQLFYVVVLLVALAGQVSGAAEALRIPLLVAVPAVAALELGGIVVLANADVRRRLGERALGCRVLSAGIAGWAVAFNWLAHVDHLRGGFFAGMSALGYLVWLMHTGNQRRDRLRAHGDLPPTTPAYEVIEHWLRRPVLTAMAKSLAKADPTLDLYRSLDAARTQIRRRRRQHAISVVLHRKIRAAVDPATADIAIAVYDLDQIAARLADSADYDTLTALIGADLAPARLITGPGTHPIHRGTNPDAPAGELQPARADPVTASDAPAASCVAAAATRPPSPLPPRYQPTGDDDAAMYQTWCAGVAAGQEPTGADLARAAGRTDDTTGLGRRAARRYRDAHATAADTNGTANRWHPNGYQLTATGATS